MNLRGNNSEWSLALQFVALSLLLGSSLSSLIFVLFCRSVNLFSKAIFRQDLQLEVSWYLLLNWWSTPWVYSSFSFSNIVCSCKFLHKMDKFRYFSSSSQNHMYPWGRTYKIYGHRRIHHWFSHTQSSNFSFSRQIFEKFFLFVDLNRWKNTWLFSKISLTLTNLWHTRSFGSEPACNKQSRWEHISAMMANIKVIHILFDIELRWSHFFHHLNVVFVFMPWSCHAICWQIWKTSVLNKK